MFKPKDFITIQCDAENQLVISGPEITVEFQTNKLDNDDRFQVKLDLNTKFLIWEKTKFIENLKKAFGVEYYVVMQINKTTKPITSIKVWSKTNSTDSIKKMEFTLKAKVLEPPEKPFSISYRTEYLIDFLKSGYSEEVIIELDKSFPIHLIIPIDQKSKLECWIAPRLLEGVDLLP